MPILCFLMSGRASVTADELRNLQSHLACMHRRSACTGSLMCMRRNLDLTRSNDLQRRVVTGHAGVSVRNCRMQGLDASVMCWRMLTLSKAKVTTFDLACVRPCLRVLLSHSSWAECLAGEL